MERITKAILNGMAQTLSETTGIDYYICYQYGRAYLYKHEKGGSEYVYPCSGTKSEVYYFMVAMNNAVRDYKYRALK